MLPDFGTKIVGLPRKLVFVRVLEEFEGEILTEYSAAIGSGLYLEKWCTCSEGISRSLLVRTEQRSVAEYLGGRITMLDLLTSSSDGGGFLIDRNSHREVVGTFSIRFDMLPDGYLPEPTALHDEDLRPSWSLVPQNFLINTDWDAKLLAMIEKQYLGMSAFAYFTEIGKNRKLPPNVLRYSYDGGFSIMHLYNGIRSEVPANCRAKSVGVSAASPGVLTIDAPASTVNLITKSFESLVQSESAYNKLHTWSKLSPARIDGMPEPQEAFGDIKDLAAILKIDHLSLFPDPTEAYLDPMSRKESILVAGKMIASYYRKLWQILKPEPRVEFISVRLNTHTLVAPTNAFEEEDEV